jgi:hypothetical protein
MPKTRKSSGRRNATIKDEHRQSLAQYSEMSGVSMNELLDEALEIYIEASLSVDMQELQEQAANA